MLYNSFDFIFAFLPLCFLLYFVTARISGYLANAALVGMSLLFYSVWDWHNLPILLASILFNYAVGARLRRVGPRWVLIVGVAFNLTLLGYFKYWNFAVANLAAMGHWSFKPNAVLLPLGISFFTFTQIAFLVDAWRGQARELDPARYGLFVTFFPHLIAGPIVHHRELMPQFATVAAKRINLRNISLALAFFAIGLFKKTAIADTLAAWVKPAFAATAPLGCASAWEGVLAFTMQIYFDFSGYSDMAVGLGLLFNVRLPDNFNAPYRAASIADFWRRWHMTLSRFLRDYLYIPLGGSRCSQARTLANLMITMTLGGLWHGAGWTFILWGAYHGVLLMINRLWQQSGRSLWPLLSRPLTFLAVIVGWVIFHSESLRQTGVLLKSMSGFAGWGQPPANAGPHALALAILLIFVNVAPTTTQWVQSRKLNAWRAVIIGTLLFIALLAMRTSLISHRPSEFIYFQF